MGDLQARVDRVSWYHDFDFGNGVRARSSHENPDGVRTVWAFIEEQLRRVPFAGATVLDVGAWDGYWSFFAERRGARHVLATDDATQRWTNDSGIGLAKELLGSSVEIREDLPIYELASLGQTFDVILCLGVYYHLRDPLFAFTQLRHCCHRDTVVVVEGELAWAGMTPNEMRCFQSAWQESLLSASVLENLLRLAYLQVDEQVWMSPVPDGASTPGPVEVERALTVCRPFEGHNMAYVYRPHFGLAAYDDRFRERAPSSARRRAVIGPIEIPGIVEPGTGFRAVVRVDNTGGGRWRALAVAALAREPIVSGHSVRRRDAGVDLERAFLDKEIAGGRLADTHAVERYRHLVESQWLEGGITLGVQLWDAEGRVRIDQDYSRGFVHHDVEPGEAVHVGVRMRAPSTPGTYLLRFDMVCEYVCWFSDAGSEPLCVPLTVREGVPLTVREGP